MGLEENKQLVLNWVEALSAGDAERICSFYAEDLHYFVVGDWVCLEMRSRGEHVSGRTYANHYPSGRPAAGGPT
jgi:hypothetical protein